MKTQTITLKPTLPQIKVPAHPVWPALSSDQKAALKQRIKALLQAQNAVLVAHYYVDGDLQELAEETGGCVADSLEMARFGTTTDAETIVVCGVRFMGETAKILNPEKRVLMPDLGATCSLDEGCPADLFSAFCDANPDRTVVVYANTRSPRASHCRSSGTCTNAAKKYFGRPTVTSATTCSNRPVPTSCCGKAAAWYMKSSRALRWSVSSACILRRRCWFIPNHPKRCCNMPT